MPNMNELRATLQACRPKMKLQNSDFLASAEADHEKAKHPGDLRRLHNRIKEHVRAAIDAGVPGEVTDGYFAFLDIIELEIQARADGDRSIDGRVSAKSGWIDADSGKEIRVFSPNESIAASSPLRADRDRHGAEMSVGGYVQALLGGGRTADIKAALSEGDNTAGGYSIPQIVLPEFIDKLRAATRFIQAGARTVMLEGMKTRLMRIESDPVAAWRAENAAVNESAPTFGAVDFLPKSLAVLVKVSNELLQDSVNAQEALEHAMIAAMALELDRACFFGSGTSNQPLGLDGTAGINQLSLGTNGGSPSWDTFIDGLYAMQAANAGNATAIVSHPRLMQSLNKQKDGQGRYLEAPEALADIPRLATTSFPINQTVGSSSTCSTAHMGDFTMAMLGLRQQLSIMMLPTVFADHLQTGFIAYLRADVQFAHPAAFTQITGIKP